MIANHKMLGPEGTDSWLFNYPGKGPRAGSGQGWRAGKRLSGREYGRFGKAKRTVRANYPCRQVIEIGRRTDGYG